MTTAAPIDWEQLHHAYGSAGDIPRLLRAIEAFPPETHSNSEPWYSLWSSLYHQGDIYTASIAAVPQIVAILSRSLERGTLSFYAMPASIAVADHENPVAVPDGMRRSFEAALERLGVLAASTLETVADETMARAARAAVLVMQGKFHEAGELLDTDT